LGRGGACAGPADLAFDTGPALAGTAATYPIFAKLGNSAGRDLRGLVAEPGLGFGAHFVAATVRGDIPLKAPVTTSTGSLLIGRPSRTRPSAIGTTATAPRDRSGSDGMSALRRHLRRDQDGRVAIQAAPHKVA
jgi:hypothetical protein